MLAASCSLGLILCPTGTALEGVAIDAASPDVSPADGIPDICTVDGLEKCPAGTDLEGVFAMGDGDLTTTAPEDTMLAANCSGDPTNTQICPDGTALAGVAVDVNADDSNPADGIPDICLLDGFEKCPAGSDLAGQFAMGDGDLDTNSTNIQDEEFDAMLAASCSLGLILCPTGTALEGVAIDAASPDVSPADGIPDICTVDGLEKCPAGTDLEGVFAMGDGDLTTTVPDDAMLAAACADTSQICPTGTALAGVAVDVNADDSNPADGIPDICLLDGFEKCPAGSDLAGQFAMGDGDLDTNTVDNDQLITHDAMLAASCSLGLILCPTGTALEGVAIDAASPDVSPADGIPDICTVDGLEKCPAGTDLEGVFAMGDGDLTTTAPEDTMLAANCSGDPTNTQICPDGTALAGVAVDVNADDSNPADGIPDICLLDGFEKCPAGSDLAGQFAMGDGDLDTNSTNIQDEEFDAMLAASCSLGLILCPTGTALEGVAIDAASPDVSPADGIPDICTVDGLEKCPAGTDLEGVFAMGDGDLTTTVPDDAMLAAACADTSQICPTGTALAGVAVGC